MTSTGKKTIKGRRIRVTRVDACGRPVYGEESQAVSRGFVRASYTLNTVDSDEINMVAADGDRLIYEPAEPSFASYSLEIEFGEVDPELFSLLTGQEVYLDYNGNAIGVSVGTDIDMTDRGFGFELWAGTVGSDACTDPNVKGSYGYFLTPFLKGGTIGDFEVTNGAVSFILTGATTRDGNQWGRGPYNVMHDESNAVAPLPTALHPQKHLLLTWVTLGPPDLFYGWRPVMDPDSTPITAVVATEGATPTETTFTFTGGSTAPVYIQFGDGEWDYVAPGTAGASHVYAENGTYTVKATTNGVETTSTVTIPWP